MPITVEINPEDYVTKPASYIADLATEFLGKPMITAGETEPVTSFEFETMALANAFRHHLTACFAKDRAAAASPEAPPPEV